MRSKSRAERARLEMLGRVNGRGGPGGGANERGRAAQAAPAVVLGVVVLLGAGIGVLHNRWSAKGKQDPALAGVRTAVYPFQAGAAKTTNAGRTAWSWVLPGKELTAENARLATENAALKAENERLRADSEEAARLRAALGLVQAKKDPPLAAAVVGLLPSPNFDTITVARGTRDGVKPQSVARTADGLVGIVSESSALTSQVTLLTDVNSGVSALVMRKGKQQGVGIVRGQGRFKPLEIVYLKREDDVKPGDTVVSSGYGGVVPPGIPVGVVTAVRDEKQGFVKSATVEPAAPMPGSLREVFLVR
jgi:rod shape-determining protein MreC